MGLEFGLGNKHYVQWLFICVCCCLGWMTVVHWRFFNPVVSSIQDLIRALLVTQNQAFPALIWSVFKVWNCFSFFCWWVIK